MENYLPAGYNEPIRAALIISLVYQATGWLVTRARGIYFNKTFMQDNFGELHQKYYKSDPVVGGYPDCGDGRYSDKLSFEGWYKFNSAVRAYLNFTEWILASIAATLLSGLFFPTYGAYLGYAVAFGRALYALGYLFSPGKRMAGAAIAEISVLLQLVLVLYGTFYTK